MFNKKASSILNNMEADTGPGIIAGIGSFLATLFTYVFFTIFFLVLVFAILKILQKILFVKKIQKISSDNDYVHLQIKSSSKNENKESAMEDFLRAIHRSLSEGAIISLEIVSEQNFIKFYIVTSRSNKSLVESQLYAQYPEVEIEEVEENLPKTDYPVVATRLKFRRQSFGPLKTYRDLEENLMKNLSALTGKSEEGEQLIIQLSLKRVGSKPWHRGIKSLLFDVTAKKYIDESTPTARYAKSSQDLYKGRLVIAYAAKEKFIAQSKLNSIVGLFKIFKGRNNELKKARDPFFYTLGSSLKSRTFDAYDFWTAGEISSIYHLPYSGSVASNVVSNNSKRAPAPDILPKEGLVDPQEVSFIGATNYRSENKVFGILRFDRRRHLYIVGKTGGGKSKLLELLLIADIKSGNGCCLLDPHGDLAQELLKHIPKERIKDVVYVNPSDRDFPIGFNPLEPVEDYEQRQQLCTFLIAIFKKLFADTWNQRMEHLVRYITLALLETPDSTIMGIPRMLSDTTYRQRVISQITDPVVKAFWTTEFSASAEQYSREAVVPLLNKVGQFVANPIVRNMVGQRKNVLDLEKFMNSGKIVLINISKGKLGEENAALLGSMFITKIQQAALSRAKMPEDERRDFYFYVDEFQNFATEAFSTILSEARKYRLDLTIAHQYMAQLPEDVKATAFGNVGTIITFAVGSEDAAYLAKEFSPVFTAEDIIHLNAREMYIKMSIDGKVTEPFSARTIDVPKPPYNFENEIISYSRLTYGKNKVSVENEIKKWTEATESVAEGAGDFPEPII